MEIIKLFLIIIILLIGITGGIFIKIYNKLVTLRNRYKNAFSQIDVQLKRRHDLIPNLVETAKAYMQHEKETLEAVMKARNNAMSATRTASDNPGDPAVMNRLSQAETALSGMLDRLMMVVENYPDLKANQNMIQLSEELTSTENRIAFARQAFNDAVMIYNTSMEVFPNNIIAGMFNFSGASFLESTTSEAERKAPKVNFGNV